LGVPLSAGQAAMLKATYLNVVILRPRPDGSLVRITY